MESGDIPIPTSTAMTIALHIFQAVDLLLDIDEAAADSTARLAAAGDELLEHTVGLPGVEIHRSIAIAIALAILDAGVIPLELWTDNLSLALDLTEDYDYLMGLVGQWP